MCGIYWILDKNMLSTIDKGGGGFIRGTSILILLISYAYLTYILGISYDIDEAALRLRSGLQPSVVAVYYGAHRSTPLRIGRYSWAKIEGWEHELILSGVEGWCN